MSAQILTVASNPLQADRLSALLAPLQMPLRQQVGLPEDPHGLFTTLPQLVIVDVTAAGPADPPLDLLRALRRHPEAEGVPLLAWGVTLDGAARIAALRAGAHEVFDQSVPQAYVFARIRNLLRARLAHDDLDMAGDSARLLLRSEGGHALLPAGRTAIVSRRREGMPPALVALAGRLPHRRGLPAMAQPPHGLAEPAAPFAGAPPPEDEGRSYDLLVIDFDPLPPAEDVAPMQLGRLLAGLRARPATRGAKILLMIPETLPHLADLAALALDLGADDLVTDTVPEEELALRVRGLLHSKAQGDRQRQRLTSSISAGLTDALTGLTNRRVALMHLRHLAERRDSHGEGYAVALLDIDHFKSVNDRFGHAAGDRALAQVAGVLRANLRAGDLVARFGGEEFLIALPDTPLPDAARVVERLRRQVAETPFLPTPGGETIRMTLSAGVADGPGMAGRGPDLAPLWQAADRALYTAKGAGRDRVALAPAGLPAIAPPLAM